MIITKGGISEEKLETMPFDEYEMWLEEAIRVQNIMLKEGGEENG